MGNSEGAVIGAIEFAERQLIDYQEISWLKCLQNFSSVQKVLSNRWMPAQTDISDLNEHVLTSTPNERVSRSPDSDAELVAILRSAGCRVIAVKDLVKTEGDRSRNLGLRYVTRQDGQQYILLEHDSNPGRLEKLIKLGKSWGFLLFGYKNEIDWTGDSELPCPDLLVISAHKLDGYLLFSNC